MLTYRVCSAYENFVKLIIQINYFLLYSFRTPHYSLEHRFLISVCVDGLKKTFCVSQKKTVLNDFLMLKARNLNALQITFEYRIFLSSG